MTWEYDPWSCRGAPAGRMKYMMRVAAPSKQRHPQLLPPYDNGPANMLWHRGARVGSPPLVIR